MNESEEYKEACKRVLDDWMIDWFIEAGIIKEIEKEQIMIKYFKELLKTLKQIESHLRKISDCVVDRGGKHGDRFTISTKHWND